MASGRYPTSDEETPPDVGFQAAVGLYVGTTLAALGAVGGLAPVGYGVAYLATAHTDIGGERSGGTLRKYGYTRPVSSSNNNSHRSSTSGRRSRTSA